jgi:hypothetical protein
VDNHPHRQRLGIDQGVAALGRGDTDGIFPPLSGWSFVSADVENRPIDADSCWNRQIRKSGEFSFEIKSANF